MGSDTATEAGRGFPNHVSQFWRGGNLRGVSSKQGKRDT